MNWTRALLAFAAVVSGVNLLFWCARVAAGAKLNSREVWTVFFRMVVLGLCVAMLVGQRP